MWDNACLSWSSALECACRLWTVSRDIFPASRGSELNSAAAKQNEKQTLSACNRARQEHAKSGGAETELAVYRIVDGNDFGETPPAVSVHRVDKVLKKERKTKHKRDSIVRMVHGRTTRSNG